MSANNPNYTASTIITDVEARLRNPGISATTYLPWISTAFNKVYQKLSEIGQHAKQEYFGTYVTWSLDTASPNEYSLIGKMPRFGGMISIRIKYGATGDLQQRLAKLRSVDNWANWDQISVTYRGKENPLYYIFGDTIGFIPVPPELGGTIKAWYVKRAFQITDGADVLDIPYRFMYPIFTYVQARAIERAFEDYGTAKAFDRQFEAELEQIALAAASEFSEDDDVSVETDSSDLLYDDPFRQ